MAKALLHARLQIKIGGYERFCQVMAKQVVINEGFGWKLHGAWVNTTGRVYLVNHMWELPDANSFFDATTAWRAGTDYAEFRDGCAATVDEETLSFVRLTPYSPDIFA